MEGRANRFIIVYKSRGDVNSDYMELRAEAHYRSKEHVENRLRTIRTCRIVDQKSIKWFEYLTDSFSWPGSGIIARFVVDMKVTKLQPLRDML